MKPKKNSAKKTNDTANALIGKHMSEVQVNLKKQREESEIIRKKHYELYIDETFNYSQTLEDFKEKVETEKRGSDEGYYLKFLRLCKETYGNSFFYHTQYTDSSLGNEHKAIKDFCSQEIKLILKDDKSNRIYWYKDGVQVNSDWNFLIETGFEKGMLDTYGATINPTHDFELLKPIRLNLYEQAKQNFIAERKINKLKISNFELNHFYIAWLNHELEVIAQWLSNKYPSGKKKPKPSVSEQMELHKYKSFIEGQKEEATHALKLSSIEQTDNSHELAMKLSIAELFLSLYKLGMNLNN